MNLEAAIQSYVSSILGNPGTLALVVFGGLFAIVGVWALIRS